MTDAFHDTLAAEARARETIEHDTREIGEKLEQIKWWYPQVTDTILTVSSQSLDLTGIPSTGEAPMPGGDALAMIGPWSPGYDEPDALPHPAQIVHEWADRWRTATRTPTPAGAKWAAHLAILQANTAWFVRQDSSGEFRADIRAVHGRLQAITGNAPDKPQPEPTDITTMGHLIPEHVTLTRDEAEHFWPGKLDTKAWDRLRQRAKYHREKGENIPPRRYPVTWIREEITPHLTSV